MLRGVLAMKAIFYRVCAACLLFMELAAHPANAVTTTYTNDTAFFAAAGPLHLQDFNSSPISSVPGTSITYPNLVVSCSGSGFCSPTGFGTSTASKDGLSVYFVSPSTATFTFHSPIRKFGIYIGGLGTILPGWTDFSISNSNGFSSVIFPHYASTTETNDFNLFAGLISDSSFTSVSLMGTEIGDGIFLDDLYYGQSATKSVTPLPAALPLFATGLGLLGLLGWRRKRKQAAA
jgi:hypothetical protein